jgi:adenylate cyclase class IV
LRAARASVPGARGQIRKRRELWMWQNVRIHLDEVEGRGVFVEFEAVMQPGEPDHIGHEKIAVLREALAIFETDLIGGSYGDALLESPPQPYDAPGPSTGSGQERREV